MVFSVVFCAIFNAIIAANYGACRQLGASRDERDFQSLGCKVPRMRVFPANLCAGMIPSYWQLAVIDANRGF